MNTSQKMEDLFAGEIESFVGSHDWSQTPLGATETWSSELKAAVQILVTEIDRTKTSSHHHNPSPEKNQQRYHTLLESIEEGFAIAEVLFDPEGRPVDYRFLEVNRLFEPMTGLKQVIGKTALELVPGLEDFWVETYGKVVLTGKSVRFEHQAMAMNRWFEVNAFPIDAPLEFRFGVLFTDITDRRRSEESIRLIQERLEISLEAANMGVWELDLITNSIWRSIEYDQIFGYDRLLPVWTYETFLSHVIPEDRARVDREFKRSIETQTSWDMECRIRGAEGEMRWIWTKARTEYNDRGEPVRMRGVVRYINDLKRTVVALQQSEERYRHLVELIPQLVWTADLEGMVLDVNQRWLTFTGLSTPEEAKSYGLKPFIHPDDIEVLGDQWKVCQQMGIPLQAEGRIRRHDGVYRWYLHQAIPLKDDRGKVIKWFGTGTDIEEQKQLEQQYANLLQKIQERNQELDQFSYIVSHDLKAPLRAITNLTQWLEDDLLDLIPPENQQQLQLMRSRVTRMEELINGLLNYARIGREDIPLDMVSVEELLADIIDSLAPPPTFSIEIDSDLPTFRTKRVLLNQVLANLIGNAIKHHDRHDGKVKIAVQEYPEFYEFVISDDGRGIDPKQQMRIFDIFQTLEGQDKNQSTGIGLTIVKKMVETEGGKIQLKSEVGKGSTFSFTWRKWSEFRIKKS